MVQYYRLELLRPLFLTRVQTSIKLMREIGDSPICTFLGLSDSFTKYKTLSPTIFYLCTIRFDICKVRTQTNPLFIKLDKVLKFTLKITLTCSYMFLSLSTTIIREPSLEPG